MENEDLRRIADAAALRDVQAAEPSIMPMLEEAMSDAQKLGIHAGSIQEWACAKYGKPLSELSARETAGDIAHVNKLILQKRQLMEARSDWDASGAI